MSDTLYRTITEDSGYITLTGPQGFECMLTEPEDRTWGRDLRPVVERLNQLEAERDSLAKENGELRKAAEWVSLINRSPECYEAVLVCTPHPMLPITWAWLNDDGTWRNAHLFSITGITHWKPIPDRPEGINWADKDYKSKFSAAALAQQKAGDADGK